MKPLTFSLGPTPATLWGPGSEAVFLFVHGLGGNRREAAPFAELAVPLGWQVLSVDLPEHGGRRDGAPPSPGTTFSGPGATLSTPSAGRPPSSAAPRTPWSPAPPWTASSRRIPASSP